MRCPQSLCPALSRALVSCLCSGLARNGDGPACECIRATATVSSIGQYREKSFLVQHRALPNSMLSVADGSIVAGNVHMSARLFQKRTSVTSEDGACSSSSCIPHFRKWMEAGSRVLMCQCPSPFLGLFGWLAFRLMLTGRTLDA